jgi:AcrR family transcriptional regulator
VLAAIDLMAERRYKTVTKEIAKAASVSEMTVFRYFGSKLNILEHAVDQYSVSIPLAKVFKDHIVWDLEKTCPC